MVRISINGLGRIGRAVLKIALDHPELELVAVNDLIPPENLAYLINYDTVYGRNEKWVDSGEASLKIDGIEYPVFSEKDPADLPWKKHDVDVVFECTGIFTDEEGLKKHIDAGAGLAILSAPAKEGDVATIVHGVNRAEGRKYFSCASCTTNCITPVMEIMGRTIGVKKAIMTTTHAYTSSQAIVDGFNKKMRRGRAGAANLVPTSTGAALATTKALPELAGKFDGVAVRAPIPCGSISDINLVTERDTSVEEINDIFRNEAQGERYKGIIGYTEDELVSSDILMDPRASIIDGGMTQVVDGDLVKIMAWYDNEWGYANQMVREALLSIKG
ncbi:MAG: type I glyceraldehyde-3-phosphate dehydrogenase [Desulfuromonadales bacterium]